MRTITANLPALDFQQPDPSQWPPGSYIDEFGRKFTFNGPGPTDQTTVPVSPTTQQPTPTTKKSPPTTKHSPPTTGGGLTGRGGGFG